MKFRPFYLSLGIGAVLLAAFSIAFAVGLPPTAGFFEAVTHYAEVAPYALALAFGPTAVYLAIGLSRSAFLFSMAALYHSMFTNYRERLLQRDGWPGLTDHRMAA